MRVLVLAVGLRAAVAFLRGFGVALARLFDAALVLVLLLADAMRVAS